MRIGFEFEYEGCIVDPKLQRRNDYRAVVDDPYILYSYDDGNYEICSKPVQGLLEFMKAYRHTVFLLAASGKNFVDCGHRWTGFHISMDDRKRKNINYTEQDSSMCGWIAHRTITKWVDDSASRYSKLYNRKPYSVRLIDKGAFFESKMCKSTLNPYAILKYVTVTAVYVHCMKGNNYKNLEFFITYILKHHDNPLKLIRLYKEVTNDNCSTRSIFAICNDIARIVNPSFDPKKKHTKHEAAYNKLGHATEYIKTALTCSKPNALQQRVRAIAKVHESWATEPSMYDRLRTSVGLGSFRVLSARA